jgi:hypothetical protein
MRFRFLHFGRRKEKQNNDDPTILQSVPRRRRLTSATDGQSIIQRRITWTDDGKNNVNNDNDNDNYLLQQSQLLQREVDDLKYENSKLRARLGRRPSYDHVTRLLPQHTSQTLSGKRILIVGGGPAGLALAVSLHQRGCEVRVHERSTAMGVEQQQQSSTNKTKKGFGWLLMPNGVMALG